VKKVIKQILKEIETGNFAKEWMTAQRTGARVFNRERKNLLSHHINSIEDKLANIRKEVFKVL